MSQKHVEVALQIEASITLDDNNEPQFVTVQNTGNIPQSGVRAIATEALECHFGSVSHGYRVQLSPEEVGDDFHVFEVYKSLIGTRK